MLFVEIFELIKCLRNNIETENNWHKFRELVTANIDEVCGSFNTRWLVSICDTYVDFGTDIEKRNAMLISLLVSMEKLGQTNMLIYHINENKDNIKILRSDHPIELWDGMKSFNIKRGNLTNNMFSRLEKLLSETPVLMQIYHTVLYKLKSEKTILSNLHSYHKRIFNLQKYESIFRKIRRNLKKFY